MNVLWAFQICTTSMLKLWVNRLYMRYNLVLVLLPASDMISLYWHNLYRSRFSCLKESLEETMENNRDRAGAAEVSGLLIHAATEFPFILLLNTFGNIPGLTKPLFDSLQPKDLILAIALEMVDSVKKILIESRSAEYFQNHIWQPAEEMTEEAGIDLTLPITGRKTRLQRRLEDGYCLKSTGGRAKESVSTIIEANRVI